MGKCRKHEAVPDQDPFRRLQGYVSCKNCGRTGLRSNGRRTMGRPLKIKWLHLSPPPAAP